MLWTCPFFVGSVDATGHLKAGDATAVMCADVTLRSISGVTTCKSPIRHRPRNPLIVCHSLFTTLLLPLSPAPHSQHPEGSPSVVVSMCTVIMDGSERGGPTWSRNRGEREERTPAPSVCPFWSKSGKTSNLKYMQCCDCGSLSGESDITQCDVNLGSGQTKGPRAQTLVCCTVPNLQRGTT